MIDSLIQTLNVEDRSLTSIVISHDLKAALSTGEYIICLLYTSDAADERSSVDLGGRRIIKKKKKRKNKTKKQHVTIEHTFIKKLLTQQTKIASTIAHKPLHRLSFTT